MFHAGCRLAPWHSVYFPFICIFIVRFHVQLSHYACWGVVGVLYTVMLVPVTTASCPGYCSI